MKYKNAESPVKGIIRSILTQKINIKEGEEHRVLSLPADNFYFEKKIIDTYPNTKFTIHALESDREVYLKGMQTIQDDKSLKGKANIWLNNQKTTKYLKDVNRIWEKEVKDPPIYPKTKFNTVWLDYCCQLSPFVFEDLGLLAKTINANSVVAITLMGRRELKSTMNAFRDEVPYQLTNEEIREQEFPKSVSKTLGLHCESIYRYLDNTERNKAAPMYLYIFKGLDTEETNTPIYQLTFTQKNK